MPDSFPPPDPPEPPEPSGPRVRVLVYATATGEIAHEAKNCPLSLAEAQAGDGQSTLVTDEGDGGSFYYVVEGNLVERPTLTVEATRPFGSHAKFQIAADGDDVATIELPGDFTVLVDGAPVAATDRFEFASDMPAIYLLEVDHFPYRPLRVEVIAV